MITRREKLVEEIVTKVGLLEDIATKVVDAYLESGTDRSVFDYCCETYLNDWQLEAEQKLMAAYPHIDTKKARELGTLWMQHQIECTKEQREDIIDWYVGPNCWTDWDAVNKERAATLDCVQS